MSDLFNSLYFLQSHTQSTLALRSLKASYFLLILTVAICQTEFLIFRKEVNIMIDE